MDAEVVGSRPGSVPRGKKKGRGLLAFLVALAMVGATVVSCSSDDDDNGGGNGGGGGGGTGGASDVIDARGLTDDDVRAALMTYQPSGAMDDYIMFASGGHSGQVFVIGLPSMRILREIAVFTPEPWQGYGFGASMDVLEGGDRGETDLRWGDTHHPALSETAGDYDGEFLFINDKANARLAVIDLRDFETKQIVANPLVVNDHGGTFVTPGTEYIVEGGQYAQPLGGEYAGIDDYDDSYRGMITFWKFDREAGRVDESQSFAVELPPYWQDLCDAGKGPSEGWVFCNSINSERAPVVSKRVSTPSRRARLPTRPTSCTCSTSRRSRPPSTPARPRTSTASP